MCWGRCFAPRRTCAANSARLLPLSLIEEGICRLAWIVSLVALFLRA